MDTDRTKIGGCVEAIVINHALETVRPTPPIRAELPRIVESAILNFLLFIESPSQLLRCDPSFQ